MNVSAGSGIGTSSNLQSRSHEVAMSGSCGEGIKIFLRAEVTKLQCFDVAEGVVKKSRQPKSRSCDVSMLRRGLSKDLDSRIHEVAMFRCCGEGCQKI